MKCPKPCSSCDTPSCAPPKECNEPSCRCSFVLFAVIGGFLLAYAMISTGFISIGTGGADCSGENGGNGGNGGNDDDDDHGGHGGNGGKGMPSDDFQSPEGSGNGNDGNGHESSNAAGRRTSHHGLDGRRDGDDDDRESDPMVQGKPEGDSAKRKEEELSEEENEYYEAE